VLFACIVNRWNEVHDTNSDRLLDLCLDLRGFYLKSGKVRERVPTCICRRTCVVQTMAVLTDVL
jgi:hypothetical protein